MYSRPMTLLVLALVALGCPASAPLDYSGPVAGWEAYGATAGGSRYSPLTQITPKNVGELEIAWTFHTGDLRAPGGGLPQSTFQATPILLDDALVFCTPYNRVIALDAETGAQRWAFDPGVNVDAHPFLTCRGVSAWRDADRPEGETCARRIFTGTVDARLIALDAATGLACEDFGEEGQVDLTHGLGQTLPHEYAVTSAPAVIEDRIVVGAYVIDHWSTDVPGGVVRAFDARSGALVWAWDPVPPGQSRKPDGTYRRTTANAWSTLSVDQARGLIFAPTGNAGPDFFGGARKGLDHYSSSVVALDARTGEEAWHFQTVHHDLWDYDAPAQPTLFEFPGPNGPVPALVQSTKMGHLFFLYRETGVPIFPVEERPVPQGAAPGEFLSPTQPVPTLPPPLHPHGFGPDDAWGLTPWDRGKCREQIAALRHEGIFTPPSEQGTVLNPGALGGGNWGGVAIDPERRILVVNQQHFPMAMRLVPRAEYDARPPEFQRTPMKGTPYGLDMYPLMSPLGVPCKGPPWGTLAGVSIKTGEILYQVPLGTTRDLAPWPFWYIRGVPNLGGPIATGSGLTFIAATADDFLRAFDTTTGKELWKGRLPAGGQATPMTYRLGERSRQFVVIAAGGHFLTNSTPGDTLVAFALPD